MFGILSLLVLGDITFGASKCGEELSLIFLNQVLK